MQTKITERIQKLLSLSRSDNEHEAAQAATRAAQLMAEHEITEAMLEVVDEDHKPEPIETGTLGADELTKSRVAWREAVTSAVARSYGCHTYFSTRSILCALGRASAVSAWRYTCSYLFAEIDRLADEAWLREGRDLVAVGQRPRAWKNAFRLGAAHIVRDRLWATTKERKTAQTKAADQLSAAASTPDQLGGGASTAIMRSTQALAIVERGAAEVEAAFTKKTSGPGWRKMPSVGQTSSRSGYSAGREAGATIGLTSKGSLGSGS